ncbi:uncharacterized protein LOC128725864 [Anopheles nili]|uniref:uncharacterized protein LOC128725864 n=1 Tax=Anopheles nili TaxID=185578 RepID=UPI00237B8ED0|nr:uncharacterized protein LOC128725864 [Anopheles nili]
MIKVICILALMAVVSCLALPVEEHPKLSRPSPINPDVTSDPKPVESKEGTPASTTTEGNPLSKVPASGVKLSEEVEKREHAAQTTDHPEKHNPKRSLESEATESSSPKPPAFRRNQPSTTTEQPSSTTTSSTTSSPVSVKTPVGTTRGKREVDITAATVASTVSTAAKRTTTVAPSSGANNDDSEGPHYVRPVPVDQILKNLNQQSEKSATTEGHKSHEKPKEDDESEEDSKEEPPKKDGGSEQTTSHLKSYPVIHQQGA